MFFDNIIDLDTIDTMYQSNENSLVICDKNLKILRGIRDNSIDLIFADPPYNLGKDFGNDSDKCKDSNTYIDRCKEWIDECFRILKDTGTFYFMNATQNMPFLDVYVSEKYNVICRIVWTYDSSGVQSRKNYGSLYEPILMCNKSSKNLYTFNSNDILVEAKTGSERKLIDYRKNPPAPYNTKKVPGNVWEFSRVRYKMSEYENHPSQKPTELLKRIILASSNEGDTVLDPFSGSFTTSEVAVNYGRNAIGIDMNKDYFKIGLRRTGVTDIFEGEILKKDLARKTTNKSKKSRMKDLSNEIVLQEKFI